MTCLCRHRWRYSSNPFTSLVLEGSGWSAPQPSHSPRKDPYPSYRRLGGPWGCSGWAWKIPPPWTVHPEASYYSDYTIPASTVYISHYMYGDGKAFMPYQADLM